ncbi:MAG: hypothetical protein IJ088_01315, partial [Clostridia bacterium]|nr:hypothetical protein [Clostridia bacterium]
MRRTGVILFLLLICFTLSAAADSLFVDNQESDKNDLMRLNMRSQPTAGGAVIGSFYTGAEVQVLSDAPVAAEEVQTTPSPEATAEGENGESKPETGEQVNYVHVEIAGIQGYMSEKFLITREEAAARYGENGWFGQCRPAEADLTGMWSDNINLLSGTDDKAVVAGTVATGESVHMVGIIGNWAYVFKDSEQGRIYGFLPIDVVTETGNLKNYVVSTGSSDARMILYETPNQKGKNIMSMGNGTNCVMLFGRGEGLWRRVRVGGVSGWVYPTKKNTLVALGTASRSTIPYYPLVMETKGDCILYSVRGDRAKPYMTLGGQMKVEVLGESQNYVYARTLIGGSGAYGKGDYGYIAISDLTLSVSKSSVGVMQVDDEDMPVIVYHEPDKGSAILGALCGGAQVRLLDYTQTEFVRIVLNDLTGYVEKKSVRLLTQATDPLSARIPQRGTAKANTVLCSEPSGQGAETGTAEAGSKMYMLGKFGDWMYVNAGSTPNLDISSQNETTGFVPLAQISAPASTSHLIAFVKTDKVNLRSIGD